MPLFLIPFLMLAAGNTRMHKHQADAALMEAETHRMELHLREYEAAHHIKDPERCRPLRRHQRPSDVLT
jgi:hypothetical protein